MKRLFLVVLVLVVLTIPVSAYDLLQERTYANASSNPYWTHWGFSVPNNSMWDENLTRIEYTGYGYLNGNASAPLTGTFDSVLCNTRYCVEATHYWGNATVTYEFESRSDEFASVTITLDIIDLDFGGLTGDMYIINPNMLYTDSRLLEGSCSSPFDPYDTFAKTEVSRCGAGNYKTYSGTSVTTPEASFSCTPTSQFPDTDVVCTDTSTNSPTDWLWTIDAEGMGIEGWQTSNVQNFSWQSHYPGLYSVNLRANNSAGFNWENKTNYVSISENATPNNCNIPPLEGYSRTSFQCTDAMSSAAIIGCDIQLHDLEGGAWSNITGTPTGTWCIDTLPSHHINGYGQSTGYTDGSLLNKEEWNGQTYTILMIPGYVPPAAEGYIWVYIHVTDWSGSQDISGATVSISASGVTTVSGTTDSSGIAHLQFPNATESYINTAKAGYTTAMTVITTSHLGPDTVNVKLHAGTQTMTIVPTTGPGGTVPTTIGPWGSQTPGPGSTMPSGYTNTQGQAIMDLLAYYGYDLVLLCILVTIMALLGVRLGGK